jgi:hypothetical protein
VAADYVAEQEAMLQGLVVQPAAPSEALAYPLDSGGADAKELQRTLHKELQESWEMHHKSPVATAVVAGARQVIEGMQVRGGRWQLIWSDSLAHCCWLEPHTNTVQQRGLALLSRWCLLSAGCLQLSLPFTACSDSHMLLRDTNNTACHAFNTSQVDAQAKRQQVEQWLLRSLGSLPATTGPPAAAFRLLRHCGTAPSASLADLLHCALHPQLLLQFNPFLSQQACCQVHQGLLVWLALCVLEDKLGRLVGLAEGVGEKGGHAPAALIKVGHCGRSAMLLVAGTGVSQWHSRVVNN